MSTGYDNFNTLALAASIMREEEEKEEQRRRRVSLVAESTPANSSSTEPNDDDDKPPYWMHDDWVPLDEHGKQRSAAEIRKGLKDYMNQTDKNKTSVLRELGVHSKSYVNFMSPYKQPWRAMHNGTYWAAARLLEAERNKTTNAITPITTSKHKTRNDTPSSPFSPSKTNSNTSQSGKNKRKASSAGSTPWKTPKTTKHGTNDRSSKSVLGGASSTLNKFKNTAESTAALELIESIVEVETEATEFKVFESTSEVRNKINAFLEIPGLTKADFCRALGGINPGSLAHFRGSKNENGSGNITYRRAWVFFEKKRILDGEPKSAQRIQNEEEYPEGFELKNLYFRPRGRRSHN